MIRYEASFTRKGWWWGPRFQLPRDDTLMAGPVLGASQARCRAQTSPSGWNVNGRCSMERSSGEEEARKFMLNPLGGQTNNKQPSARQCSRVFFSLELINNWLVSVETFSNLPHFLWHILYFVLEAKLMFISIFSGLCVKCQQLTTDQPNLEEKKQANLMGTMIFWWHLLSSFSGPCDVGNRYPFL